jgi:epoxyqueuosine reductase
MPGPGPGVVGEALSRWVVERCTGELGFALAGVCEARPSDRAEAFMRWLEQGHAGQMAYLRERAGTRLDASRELPGVRSVLMVAERYAPRGHEDGALADGHARVARYARGRDYHLVLKKRLHRLADALRASFPGERFRSFVDSAPVHEREHAQRAGLGWVGKHTLLIHPRAGSWFVLGGMLTTLHLPELPEGAPIADACGTCTRCIDVCPTGAITPYSVNASRCISYLTLEHEGPVDADLGAQTAPWLAGCDVCQEVCPHNSARAGAGVGTGTGAESGARARASLPILDVLAWDGAERARALGASAVKRASLEMLRRNAVLATLAHLRTPGSAQKDELRARLVMLEADAGESPGVREAARLVLRAVPEGT